SGGYGTRMTLVPRTMPLRRRSHLCSRVGSIVERCERFTLRRDQEFFKGDVLVACQHRLAGADETVAVAYRRRNVHHLVATPFALAQPLQRATSTNASSVDFPCRARIRSAVSCGRASGRTSV